MLDVNELVVFAKVAQLGSFSAAATALAMPKSTVSRKVAELEERLGARLLQRTTRKLSLTDVGRTYQLHCARVVAEIDEAERAVGSLQDAPRGLLRVTAPINFAFLGTMLARFLANYPELRLELVCTDRVVNLIEEGFDVGIRAGPLSDSTLIARSVGSVPRFLVAGTGYLKLRGRPRTPDDLARHDCMVFGGTQSTWTLTRGGEERTIAVNARLVANDFDMLHDAAVAGLGIALIPAFHCTADLRAGQLHRVLKQWTAPSAAVHAVYPSTRHLSPKVKALIDHLQLAMSPPPWGE